MLSYTREYWLGFIIDIKCASSLKMYSNILLLTSLLLILSLAYSKSFDWATGNTSVWLSAAAYCETNTYLSRTFKGYSSGFVVTNVIDNKAADVQVYIYIVCPDCYRILSQSHIHIRVM